MKLLLKKIGICFLLGLLLLAVTGCTVGGAELAYATYGPKTLAFTAPTVFLVAGLIGWYVSRVAIYVVSTPEE